MFWCAPHLVRRCFAFANSPADVCHPAQSAGITIVLLAVLVRQLNLPETEVSALIADVDACMEISKVLRKSSYIADAIFTKIGVRPSH